MCVCVCVCVCVGRREPGKSLAKLTVSKFSPQADTLAFTPSNISCKFKMVCYSYIALGATSVLNLCCMQPCSSPSKWRAYNPRTNISLFYNLLLQTKGLPKHTHTHAQTHTYTRRKKNSIFQTEPLAELQALIFTLIWVESWKPKDCKRSNGIPNMGRLLSVSR